MLINNTKPGALPPDLSDYYAEYIISSLSDTAVTDPESRAEATWISLIALEKKLLVSTSRILGSLESSSLTALRDSIAISHGGVAAMAYDDFKKSSQSRISF